MNNHNSSRAQAGHHELKLKKKQVLKMTGWMKMASIEEITERSC